MFWYIIRPPPCFFSSSVLFLPGIAAVYAMVFVDQRLVLMLLGAEGPDTLVGHVERAGFFNLAFEIDNVVSHQI